MPVSALMIGAGEYTTGCVGTAAGAAPDKPAGVVAITFADLRRRGRVDNMVLVDAVGTRMPTVRDTMRAKIAEAYKDMDVRMTTLPRDDVAFDPMAYKEAIARMRRGDVATIFTPDDTHFDIALACIEAGLHVLCAKPLVKTLAKHRELAAAAEKHGVLCAIEYHKRFDPIYADARDRIRAKLGAFSFFQSTMTQPKAQLDTFKAWAGKSSDISYYLNSHHMDVHCWSVGDASRPERVVAFAATGAANARVEPTDGRQARSSFCVTQRALVPTRLRSRDRRTPSLEDFWVPAGVAFLSARRRPSVSIATRRESHCFPYDRVGVVNFIP